MLSANPVKSFSFIGLVKGAVNVPVAAEDVDGLAIVPVWLAATGVAFAGDSVNIVDVALSSIPVDAKFEITPPCTLSPEIESSSSVKV